MARSPVIQASIVLDNKLSAVLKQVEAEVLKVTKEGNVDAAQLSTVFAQAAQKASQEIGRSAERIQQDFTRIQESAEQTGGEINRTGDKANRLKNELGQAADKGSLLDRTLKGLGNTALAIGPALAQALAGNIQEAKTYEREVSKFAAQGYGDDLTRKTAARVKTLSEKYPGVSQTDIMGDAATALGSFGPQALNRALYVMTTQRAAMINAGLDPAGLDTSLRTFENVYGNNIDGGVDPVTHEKNPTLEEFIKRQTATKISFAGLVNAEDLSQFYKTGKVAAMDLSMEGTARLSTLIGDEGGARAGTELATLSNALVGGHLTKTGKEIAAKLGVYNSKDLVRNRDGDYVPNATAKPKDYELLKTDPTTWVRNLMEAASAKGVAQTDAEAMIQKMVPRNAADFIIKANRQYEASQQRVERVNRAVTNVDKLPDDHASLSSKLNDAKGKEENNRINSVLPGMETFANASNLFQDAVALFNGTVLKIPGVSGAANVLATGAVSTIGAPILQFLSLAGLVKVFPQLLPPGLRGLVTDAPKAAGAAGEAVGEAGAAGAAEATLAGAGAAEGAAAGVGVAEAGGGLLAGLGLGALELSPLGLGLTAAAGLGAAGAGLWALLGKLKAQRDAKLKLLQDQFTTHPESLSGDDLDFLQKQSLADAMEAQAKLSAAKAGSQSPAKVAEQQARVKRDMALAAAAKAEAQRSAPPSEGATQGSPGLPGKGRAGQAPGATLAPSGAPPALLQVIGKADLTQTIRLEPSAKFEDLIKSATVVEKTSIRLSAHPFDNPQSAMRR